MVKIGTVDPLSLLERKDKWFLGGGKGAIYAPPFPRWLEKPGFWDESYFADIRLTRLFTVLFCDYGMHFVRFRGEVVSWRPDRMIVEHRSSSHVVRETRLVTEAHEWVSSFELVSGEPLMAFVWALPEMQEPGYGAPWQSLVGCEVTGDSISYEFATAWPSELEPDRTAVEDERTSPSSISRPLASAHLRDSLEMEEGGRGVEVPGMLPSLSVHLSLGANRARISHTVNLAQRHDDSPLWETSLLPQKLRGGQLPGDFKLEVGPPPFEGLVHLVQQYELGRDEPLVVSCRASLGAKGGGRAVGSEVVQENEQAWRDYFASVPQFSSSDPYLTNAYWYRWYGLRLNTVDVLDLQICRGVAFQAMRASTFQVEEEIQGQDGPDTYRLEADATFSPFITEGIGFFRNFITYSAQAHLREVAWMHSPRMVLGILEDLKKCQRADGSFPGHNYSCRPARDFYHADFATGTQLAMALHPGAITKKHLKSLRRYAWYLIAKRKIGWGGEIQVPDYRSDANGTFAVFDQNETGQEYMSRYQFVSEKADQWESFVVGGCDATTYAASLIFFVYRNFNIYLHRSKFHPDNDVGWGMWHQFDPEAAFFCDVMIDGTRSPARPASGFYPLLYGTDEHRDCFNRWLFNPDEFWLPRGFPATALSDSTFSADGEWKDKRLNCPWNGRSWPMVIATW